MYRDHEEPPRAKAPKNGFKTLEALAEFVGKTTNQWLWSWTEESLQKFLYSKLDREAESILRRTLGFEKDTFTREWKIDHCNGRMSALSELITGLATTKFQQWVEANIDKVTAKPLTAKDIKNLRDSYREHFYTHVSRRVYDRAQEDAEQFLKNFSGLQEGNPFQQVIEKVLGVEELSKTEL